MPLTVRQVEAAKPKDTPYKLTDGEGLYLYVSPAGGRSWRANFKQDGKQQTRTYGRFPEMSLADARESHRSAKRGEVKGEAPTFKDAAQKWLKTKLPGLKNVKHQGQVQGTLEEYVYPKIGDRPMDTIERKDLTAIVLGIADKVETAHRVAGRITAVFDYAVDLGEITKHPASNLTRVLPSRKVKTPMPSIPKDEAGQLMRDIATYPELTTRLALQLMAYTFPRVNEFLGFAKDELKEEGVIWLIPGERMKMPLPHVVPLARQARKIVKRLSEMSGCHLVIESPDKPGHKLSENTLLFALYRLGYKGRMTVHGFRALASTVLNEESGFPKDAIERQLAHSETDEVRAAYNRAQYLDQRRKMMQWWADWLDARTAKH